MVFVKEEYSVKLENHNGLIDVHLLVLDSIADWEHALAISHVSRPAPGRATKCYIELMEILSHEKAK